MRVDDSVSMPCVNNDEISICAWFKSVGSWHHVVGTYHKTKGKQELYVNGQRVYQGHTRWNMIVPLTYYFDMRIGYSKYKSGYFNGIIDDVRLYKRALSD